MDTSTSQRIDAFKLSRLDTTLILALEVTPLLDDCALGEIAQDVTEISARFAVEGSSLHIVVDNVSRVWIDLTNAPAAEALAAAQELVVIEGSGKDVIRTSILPRQ